MVRVSLSTTTKLTHEGRPNNIRIAHEPSAALIVCGAWFAIRRMDEPQPSRILLRLLAVLELETQRHARHLLDEDRPREDIP